MSSEIAVIDAGTSGVRVALVRDDGTVGRSAYRQVLPTSPLPTFVEFDPVEMRDAVTELAVEVLGEAGGGAVAALGITNQRSSTVLWDRVTGVPVGPGVSWQDLRTVGMCMALGAQGIKIAPNVSATKLAFLLDMADPDRSRSEAGELAFGTIDTWLAWSLSRGAVHATDPSNACVTGLMLLDGSGWDPELLAALRIPEAVLPRIAASSEVLGELVGLPGAPLLAGMAGDQQASLMGQGCVVQGAAKLTLGTGGMLDVCVGTQRPSFPRRGADGMVPMIAWRRGTATTWLAEGLLLTAGTSVEWLRDELGLIGSAPESEALAASVADSGGVVFVPAFLGLGTPRWDYGARGSFFGLTRGAGRAQLVRAVLEGIAHRSADLVEAARADTGLPIESVRLDGGMSQNAFVVQACADAAGVPVEVSPVTEATTLGAAYLAGLAVGLWPDEAATAALFEPRSVVEPAWTGPKRTSERARWAEAVARSAGWVPELSTLDF